MSPKLPSSSPNVFNTHFYVLTHFVKPILRGCIHNPYTFVVECAIVCLRDLGEITGFSNIPLRSGEGVVHAGKFRRGVVVNVLIFWYVVFDCRVVLIAATGVLYNVWLIGTVSTIRILICVCCIRGSLSSASPGCSGVSDYLFTIVLP